MTLADRLRSALSRGVEPGMILLTGDRDDIDLPPGDAVLPAAVLIAVTDRAEPGVILTQRTETMRKHAGQIAFPGGRIDPGEDIVTAALREAEEEIALPRERVTVIGQADTYRTVTGFQVTPVIGVIPPDLVLHPSEAEVANVFEVPLEFLLDSGNHVEASVEWQGHERHYYEIIWNDRRIWGATAAMIVNLRRRLQWA
ncbi:MULTISPECIES: CoA pyrophosphatase [unclassified Sphingomonas]|uniref:CoA pyrophosphatase n=1 Tax=unclassified Sphingomonas TaxID=196159 RepID=UPI0006FC211D|nr:CoA pyrophosphatase [Sphingomonas sp. Leaf30]KQN22476.1 NUDIX hydrolase [Sphingomonas sp. Leaf30]MBD8549200.1 CoA pyrophosphatase [Sphingomonas sp. CFBP 8764]